MALNDFSERNCPLCSFPESKVFMQMNSATIFANNWSYRKNEEYKLGLSKDQSFPIVQCKSCGFLYAKIMPSPELLNNIYDRIIDEDGAKKNNFSIDSMAYRMRYLDTLIRLLPSNDKKKAILDFGCGFGPTLKLLEAIPGVSAIGFEVSVLRIQYLTAMELQATNDFSVLESYMPFDAIILDNVLEHLPDPSDTLSKIRSWCNQKTIIYVSVPDSNKSFMMKQKLACESGSSVSMEINPWEHLNYFDVAHLDALFKRAGFSPLNQSELPSLVNIDLRPATSLLARLKNGVASMMRLFRYVRSGNAYSSPTMRYYRVTDS